MVFKILKGCVKVEEGKYFYLQCWYFEGTWIEVIQVWLLMGLS